MKTLRLQTRVAMIMGAALLVFTASLTHAYDTNWKKSQCDTYSLHGLGERYVFGGDCGWIDNGAWDTACSGCNGGEGVDCSSYVPRCWATDGAGDSYLGEHSCGSHPYSTYDYYPGNVPHTIRVYQSSLQTWDCWVYSLDTTGCGPGNHMGLARTFDASYIYTREARGSSYGVVAVTRSKQSLTDACARYYRRDAWGAESTAVTVDNSSAGFSVTGTWATGSGSTDKYGADYRYHSTAAVSEPAQWTAAVSGTKAVYAWWPQGSNRSTTAPYIVTHSGGTATVPKNQQVSGGTWQLLGSWSMTTGKVQLSCWTSTGYVVVADAIKWQ